MQGKEDDTLASPMLQRQGSGRNKGLSAVTTVALAKAELSLAEGGIK